MPSPVRPTRSEVVRAQLSHPVIDADGHYIEYPAALASFLRDEGIDDLRALFGRIGAGFGSTDYDLLTDAQRAERRSVRGPWWSLPAANTLDAATATFPRLLHERLDEFGIDFAVLYPTAGLSFPCIGDAALRRGASRALNRYVAESFGALADRLTPAALVPMHTPGEAIEVLEHAVGDLGLKAVMIAGFVERKLEVESDQHRVWWDLFGHDSAHDYDPFWRRCIELGVSPAAHAGSMGVGFRRSTSAYMYNHIGNFAASGEALAKALFFGGVTRRFPELRVAFLEGGVHWAVGLLADLVSRWEKRNAEAVQKYDPARLDRAQYARLYEKYGGELAERAGEVQDLQGSLDEIRSRDEFEALEIEGIGELRERFIPQFFFGCEADDPMTATAFDSGRVPFGSRLNAMFSSDIGHWDVPEMRDVLHEAWEQVERGWLDADAFRAFAFENTARFYSDSNPAFFEGTVVADAVAALRAG